MINISRESEINLINILIDQDIISGKDLANIKKVSTEKQSSQLDAVFELKLTDEEKILDLLVKEQSLDVVDLSTMEVTDEIKSVLPSNYVNINFIAFSSFSGDLSGQVFAMLTLTVAAAEASIGLAILVVFFRNLGSISVEKINNLKG